MAYATYPPVPYRYRWVSRAVMPERRGQRCTILYVRPDEALAFVYEWHRQVLIRFEIDGSEHVVDRQHIRLRARGDVGRKCRNPRCRYPVGRDGSHGMCGKHAARERRARRQG